MNVFDVLNGLNIQDDCHPYLRVQAGISQCHLLPLVKSSYLTQYNILG